MKLHYKITAICVVVCLILSICGFGVMAEPADQTAPAVEEAAVAASKMEYGEYLDAHKDAPRPIGEIVVHASQFQFDSPDITREENFEGAAQVLKWTGYDTEVSFTVDVPETGLYNAAIRYFPLDGKYETIDLALEIDGALPFESASTYSFDKPTEFEKELRYDSRGNQYSPSQQQAKIWLEQEFYDNEGRYNDPCSFYLTAGTHTISMTAQKSDLAIESFKLFNKEKAKDYATVSAGYPTTYSPTNFSTKIQAERPTLKSDYMLLPSYDKTSAATEPQSDYNMLLNTIGGEKWASALQWMEWEFEVPEDGLYQIRMRARQSLKNGSAVNRRIYIDGEVPFDELNYVNFEFENGWYIKTIGEGESGKEEPYKIYLTKGKHTLKMQVMPGELEETIRILQDSVYVLNDIYRRIMMITGPTPDTYRDYNLQNEIPGLMDTFAEQKAIIDAQRIRLEEITGQRGSESAILQTIVTQLEGFIEKPNTVAHRIEEFKANASSLASWLLDVREQPLELDYIEIQSTDGKKPKADSGFFRGLWYNISTIWNSFSGDYGMVGEISDSKTALTVWVGMGRDQVQIVKDLVDKYFTPNHDFKVNVNLVQIGLVEATLAGKGPDVSLFVGTADPVNLASRGALTDLTQFEDFDEVSQRFMPAATTPYTYLDKVYALPATETFEMLFVRTDIFEELGLQIPNTWDELYKIMPILQRNNLTVGMPSGVAAASATNSGGVVAGNFGIFPTLLYQNGQQFYSDDRSKTMFDTDEAQEAFARWCEFYTRYSLPTEYDFFNRFRTGEMPMAIAGYAEYNRLIVAAPEIRGMWTMVPIPGTVHEDGTINRTSVASGSQGCVMLRDCKNKENAWEFLKWFTSADIQAQFGIEIETNMGAASRYTPANVEALESLPWTMEEQELLMSQWQYVQELPEIPGGYYIQRNVSNAMKQVVYNYENPRHTLNTYNIEMNKEIHRKRVEFGLETE